MALKSIVDDDELKEFAKQPKSFKHESLDQFTKVVAGIRLFNKDCEKRRDILKKLCFKKMKLNFYA